MFLVFLRLGLTSFGGPVAHLAYFRQEFVVRRQWLEERAYGDLVALCQFLPGPASSQVGMALGLSRAGYPGMLAAWLGFTLPSALALALLALGLSGPGGGLPPGAIHGLKVVAVAVVAQAVWGMARSLCAGPAKAALMVLAAGAALAFPGPAGQVGIMALAALAGLALFRPRLRPGPALPSPPRPSSPSSAPLPAGAGRGRGAIFLALFAILLAGLPALVQVLPHPALEKLDAFYRAGALVFGGGHVVLPLLQAEVVPRGWVGEDAFLAGYGAAQAVPGPLFSFAAFLGAAMGQEPAGGLGAVVCIVGIFLPSFLLVAGALPFWEALRRQEGTRAALAGVNPAVVGLLLAAFYQPVWTSAIRDFGDAGLALAAFIALQALKMPPWLVVLGCGAGGLGLEGLAGWGK